MWPFFPTGTDRNLKNRPIWPATKVSYNTLLDVKFIEGSSTPTEPVDLETAKNWMKVDVSDDDDLIEELITTAREMIEGFLCISCVQRTVVAIINNANGNSYLPYGPVGDLVSIKDECGTAIASDNYSLQLEDFKRLAWPCLKYIRLEYTAGYSTLPTKLKTGLLQQVLWLYQHRGDEEHISRGAAVTIGLSPEAEATLTPYRRVV